jgi:hypothetical protein
VVDLGGGDWLMVTFDATPYGGPLPGYGTHGDVVVMEARPITSPHEFPPRG